LSRKPRVLNFYFTFETLNVEVFALVVGTQSVMGTFLNSLFSREPICVLGS